MTPKMIEVAARTIIMEHYAAYGIRMQEGVARIMAKAVLTAALAVMWHPLPPERQWVRTKREGEDGENVCALWSEWTDREGRTTVTHHSFAMPTHWMPLLDPPKETA